MTDAPAATRVLIIEDDPNIVDLIRSNLMVRGFDAVVSTDGMRALELLETESPDIVLLDLMLPQVDGLELCREIRERSTAGSSSSRPGAGSATRSPRSTWAPMTT